MQSKRNENSINVIYKLDYIEHLYLVYKNQQTKQIEIYITLVNTDITLTTTSR